MSNSTGGPAFPTVAYERSEGMGVSVMTITGGMTLRDYFAAKAMQGDLASMVDPTGKRCGLQRDLTDDQLGELGTLYYRMADAMLKAREASK